MIRIGIDTSVVVGMLDSRDVWHTPAIRLHESLKAQQADVAVFDCVLAETISTLARRLHEKRRDADLDRIIEYFLTSFPTEDILWILPDVPPLYTQVIDLVRSSTGELNFNDALIALSCRNRGITLLASFDRDFDQVLWLKRVAQPDDLMAAEH